MAAPLDQRVAEFLYRWFPYVAHPVGQLQYDGQPHAREHRRAPQYSEPSGCGLGEFKIAGPGLVGPRCGKPGQQYQPRYGEAPSDAPRIHFDGSIEDFGAVGKIPPPLAAMPSGSAGNSTV